MIIKVYNTLSGKKESLPRPVDKPLRLFVCGPTVYNLSHIGHARIYIFFDIFVRYLKSLGYKIFYLQNITDIDDKIINRAKKMGISPLKLAQEETRVYFNDMKSLGIKNVKYAPATKFIPQIAKQVQVLIRKSYAYEIPSDGYYFDIKKFKDYGKLSHRTLEQAEDAVSRIDESIKKKNKGDFALWKIADAKNANKYANDAKKKFKIINGEPLWKTSLGWGRPGWHIEDTAIADHYFGQQYELHGGGLDLKFPHHEAEIAQAEAASGKKPFVKIWMHVGLLNVAGEKMSKSLGNFITIQDFLKKHSANVLRFIIASNHYRSPLDYQEDAAKSASAALNSLQEFIAKLELIKKSGIRDQGFRDYSLSKVEEIHYNGNPSINSGSKLESGIKIKIPKYEKQFSEAMTDDMNTPRALAEVFNLVNDANKSIWNLNKTQAGIINKWLLSKLAIFGITLSLPKIPKKVQDLVKKRELLRSNKQFTQADALRKKITALGYRVEDTPLGPLVLKN